MAKRKIWKQIKFEGETWEEAEARWEKVLHKRKKIILIDTLRVNCQCEMITTSYDSFHYY